MTNIIKTVTVLFIIVSCNKARTIETYTTKEDIVDTSSILNDPGLNLIQSTIDIDTISEEEFKILFKFSETKYYNLDKDRELIRLLNEETRDFWRNKKMTINNHVKSLDIWGEPLSYKVFNENIIRLTTISEGEAGIIIRVFTFNRNYERIDTEILTSVGGDQGDVWRTDGEFINDSTYLINILTYSSDDSISTRQSYNRCIRFKGNGQVKEIENCR